MRSILPSVADTSRGGGIALPVVTLTTFTTSNVAALAANCSWVAKSFAPQSVVHPAMAAMQTSQMIFTDLLAIQLSAPSKGVIIIP